MTDKKDVEKFLKSKRGKKFKDAIAIKRKNCINCNSPITDLKRDKGYCVECAFECWQDQ